TRATAAINEVSRASEARLAAIAAYLQSASAQAIAQTQAAKALLDAEQARVAEANSERDDAAQERTSVEAQATALAESLKQRSSLSDAQSALQQVLQSIRDRSSLAEQQAGTRTATLELLRQTVADFQAREAALKDEA